MIYNLVFLLYAFVMLCAMDEALSNVDPKSSQQRHSNIVADLSVLGKYFHTVYGGCSNLNGRGQGVTASFRCSSKALTRFALSIDPHTNVLVISMACSVHTSWQSPKRNAGPSTLALLVIVLVATVVHKAILLLVGGLRWMFGGRPMVVTSVVVAVLSVLLSLPHIGGPIIETFQLKPVSSIIAWMVLFFSPPTVFLWNLCRPLEPHDPTFNMTALYFVVLPISFVGQLAALLADPGTLPPLEFWTDAGKLLLPAAIGVLSPKPKSGPVTRRSKRVLWKLSATGLLVAFYSNGAFRYGGIVTLNSFAAAASMIRYIFRA